MKQSILLLLNSKLSKCVMLKSLVELLYVVVITEMLD